MEIKDKPESMSVREWLTKKVSIDPEVLVTERVIKAVISHQFDSAYEALEFNNSVEISGFGKFYYNEKKADREVEISLQQQDACKKILESEEATEEERQQAGRRIKILEEKLQWLWAKQKK